MADLNDVRMTVHVFDTDSLFWERPAAIYLVGSSIFVTREN